MICYTDSFFSLIAHKNWVKFCMLRLSIQLESGFASGSSESEQLFNSKLGWIRVSTVVDVADLIFINCD